MSSMPPPPSEEVAGHAGPPDAHRIGESDGTMALIFGIIGIFIVPLSLVAVYFALRGQRAIAEAGVPAGSSLRWGRVLAWVSLLVFVVVIAVAIVAAVTG
jgi:hypothetical protein